MKFETFKSLILTALIALSLMLTLSLWSYQPDYTASQNTDPAFIPEVDAGGKIATKRGVIMPSRAIFHIDEQHFGFGDPSEVMNLYKDVQHWSLTEYVEREDEVLDIGQKYIEMTYPEAFPISMVHSLFTLVDDIVLPHWNFERILISMEEEQNAVAIYFPSTDDRNHVQFTVYDQQTYTAVENILDKQESLVEYMVYNEANKPLYLPVEPTEMVFRTITVDMIHPPIFVDALFLHPSIVVTPNVGESYFIDGQRDMRVVENGHRLEFINPLENTPDPLGLEEIIEQSLANINDHKGWTADFYIMTIDPSINRIVYQMHYEGYPVYHDRGLTLMEQQWRGQQLHQYNRPLFRLLSPFSGGLEELPSGNEVIYFLETSDQYDVKRVSDVQIGYYVSEIDGTSSYSISLEPRWFMLYDDKWQRIRLDIMDTDYEGGY